MPWLPSSLSLLFLKQETDSTHVYQRSQKEMTDVGMVPNHNLHTSSWSSFANINKMHDGHINFTWHHRARGLVFSVETHKWLLPHFRHMILRESAGTSSSPSSSEFRHPQSGDPLLPFCKEASRTHKKEIKWVHLSKDQRKFVTNTTICFKLLRTPNFNQFCKEFHAL